MDRVGHGTRGEELTLFDESIHPPRKPRRTLETITVERPRCPACDGVRLRKYRTLADQGDGSALWWVQCECGARFRVLLE